MYLQSTNSKKQKKNTKLKEYIEANQLTPKIKRSNSHTMQTYMQIQLQASGKKKLNLEKSLQQKDFYIQQLKLQLIQHQKLIAETICKCKQQYKDIQNKDKKLTDVEEELKVMRKQKIIMKELMGQLKEQNLELKSKYSEIQEDLGKQRIKFNKLKDKRQAQRRQWRQLVPSIANEMVKLKQQMINLY